MKQLAFPLSFVNPTLDLSFNEGLGSADERKGLRILAWDDLATEWLSDFFEETNLRRPAPEDFSLRVALRKEGGVVRADVRVRMRPELECVRSLTLFREPLEMEAEAFFREEGEAAPSKGGTHEHELTEEDLSSYELQGGRVVLDEFLLDALRTALPSHPLCRPDCKGLCGECGEVLNDLGSCAKEWKGEWGCPHFEGTPH